MAEMARRDLDAALQLLVDRAQYITGASGAAIALRRNGKNDMQCRASTGSNAPELGALLSTEFGLSGESVRTRQPLRCDDAERDVRVNREVCRHLGIASVVVMPVVNDEEVLGVFELFSGEVNAFGERDLSAVQRLSEMVEAAVRLAEATENLPERLRTIEISAPAVGDAEVEEDRVLEGQVLEELVPEGLVPENLVPEDLVLEELVLEDVVLKEPDPVLEVAAEEEVAGKQLLATSGAEVLAENGERPAPEPMKAKIPSPSTSSGQALSQKAREGGAPILGGTVAAAQEPKKAIVTSPPAEPVPVASAETAPSKKQLFWSAALNPAADAARPEDADQSHVPPGLRSLRKCEACGFPISAGRVLCVECEEKKWRGQLKVPQVGAPRQVAKPAAAAAPVAEAPKAEARVFAAAVPSTQRVSAISTVVQTSPVIQPKESKPAEQSAVPAVPAANSPGRKTASEPSERTSEVPSPNFVLSAGLAPSQSWLSANKYMICALLVVVVVIVAVLLLR